MINEQTILLIHSVLSVNGNIVEYLLVIIFRVRRTEAKSILVTAVCVSVCLPVPRRIPTLLHGPGCNLGNGRGFPLVVY